MTSGYLAISVKQNEYIVSLENSNYKYQHIGPPGYSQISAGPIYQSSGFKGLSLSFVQFSDFVSLL